MIAQPLFRNAGRGNNTRFIAIAKTNKAISSAVLEQQMIGTVAGVDNLYIDLISLQDEVKVQQQASDCCGAVVGKRPAATRCRALAAH